MSTILQTLRQLYDTNDINEDLADFNTLPTQLLSVAEVKDFVRDIPEAAPGRPPFMFKLGYMKELGGEIASKFRGGRGSDGNPKVRIIKCTEYSKLYTGVPWTSTNATKQADKILGKDRHTGERTGFNFQGEGNMVNRIGSYQSGKEALQAYIADTSVQKTKFFISIDDGELQEASRQEVAQYLTPATANRVLGNDKKEVEVTDGPQVKDKPINRFALTNIYMIGNLGHSVM